MMMMTMTTMEKSLRMPKHLLIPHPCIERETALKEKGIL
jgi:hypothetical protein